MFKIKAFPILIPVLLIPVFWGCRSNETIQKNSNDNCMIADSPERIRARKILEMESPVDKQQAEFEAIKMLSFQLPDGSWKHNPTDTGKALIDLYFLNLLSKADEKIVAAKDFLLQQEGDFVSFGADNPVWGKDWIALYALNLWGFGNEEKVLATVHELIDNMDKLFDGQNGHASSVILRAISCHELLRERPVSDTVINALGKRQMPDGLWDLGPGTSQFTVMSALLNFAGDRRVSEQLKRVFPNLLSKIKGKDGWSDPVLGPEEAQLVFFKALKLIKELKAYLKGERVEMDLSPYEVGFYTVVGSEIKGYPIKFKDKPLKINPVPIFLGTEILYPQQVLPPNTKETLLRLFLKRGASEKLQKLLKADQTMNVALLSHGKVLMVEPLYELFKGGRISIRSMSSEDSARLAKVFGNFEGKLVKPVSKDIK